jgi:hypothetical protein
MSDRLTDNEVATILRLLRKQQERRRRRGLSGKYVPGPGQRNADLIAADYLATLISKLEAFNV